MNNIIKEDLEKIVSSSNFFREMITKLGYNFDDKRISRNIERQVHRFNIDISHFLNYKSKDRYNKDKLIIIVNKSKTLKEVLLELDLLPITSNYNRLKDKLNKLNIDYSNLNGIVKNIWTEEFLSEIFKNSNSYSEALKNLNIINAGGNFKTLKKYIQLYDINIEHFCKVFKMPHKNTLNEILIENSTYNRGRFSFNKFF